MVIFDHFDNIPVVPSESKQKISSNPKFQIVKRLHVKVSMRH